MFSEAVFETKSINGSRMNVILNIGFAARSLCSIDTVDSTGLVSRSSEMHTSAGFTVKKEQTKSCAPDEAPVVHVVTRKSLTARQSNLSTPAESNNPRN
mmetsp:Transcript_7022/g.10587  ORF Transcript_7022/g.10587 Transcript_7022/m.10587 type:complete len:99 (-) Transcript_7022:1195-1491(-)